MTASNFDFAWYDDLKSALIGLARDSADDALLTTAKFFLASSIVLLGGNVDVELLAWARVSGTSRTVQR